MVKFFKGCLPQILVGLFLNTLPHFLNVFHRAMRKSCYELVLNPFEGPLLQNMKICHILSDNIDNILCSEEQGELKHLKEK